MNLIKTIALDGYDAKIFCPDTENLSEIDTVVYLFANLEDESALVETDFGSSVIVKLQGYDWNRDLSPWYAARVFAKGNDFAGGADEFLKLLKWNIIPTIEKALNLNVSTRAITGYSMGGLFSVYACLQTDLFQRAASMSGSLWYDGFAEYANAHAGRSSLTHAYFSLGKKEKLTKNSRMAKVETDTIFVQSLLNDAGVQTKFELLEGGHFDQIPQRIAGGICKMLQM